MFPRVALSHLRHAAAASEWRRDSRNLLARPCGVITMRPWRATSSKGWEPRFGADGRGPARGRLVPARVCSGVWGSPLMGIDHLVDSLRSGRGESHSIIAIFIDVRGFTRFAGIAESVDAAFFLRKFYLAVLCDFLPRAAFAKPTGDGLMVIIEYGESDVEEAVAAAIDGSTSLLAGYPTFLDADPMITFDLPPDIGIGYRARFGDSVVDGRRDPRLHGSTVEPRGTPDELCTAARCRPRWSADVWIPRPTCSNKVSSRTRSTSEDPWIRILTGYGSDPSGPRSLTRRESPQRRRVDQRRSLVGAMLTLAASSLQRPFRGRVGAETLARYPERDHRSERRRVRKVEVAPPTPKVCCSLSNRSCLARRSRTLDRPPCWRCARR